MNRLLLVCLSALVWCLAGCTDKDKIPAGVLPKEKMQKVLWDVIQAERFRETFIRDSSKDLKAETFKLYAQVFAIHKVTKDEFAKSYKFYMSRPDIAREMFDSLATKANRTREDMYKPKPLDTANVHIDSSKVKIDSSKVKKRPAVPPPVNSSKVALPQPAIVPPVFPQIPNLKKPIRRIPLKHGKSDSLLMLKLKH
jgi:hypothetical protein